MFPVDIWGTVADWFAAVGTVGAFGFAAFIYSRDSRLRRYAQARLIRFRLYNEYTERPQPVDGLPHEVIIENQSDKSIFDIYGITEKRSLAEIAIKRARSQNYRVDRKYYPLSEGDLYGVKEQWRHAAGAPAI